MTTIADISGKQFLPSSTGYRVQNWQYATTSHGSDHDMHPGLIVEAANMADVQRTVRFAAASKRPLAIRTGGHQYSGASSTGDAGILLDLRGTFRSPDDLTFVDSGARDGARVRASVSHSLAEFNAFLGKNRVFAPHGQCEAVHLGGHVQTGGYGQLGRSFGLLGDHVLALEIVDAEGGVREITRAADPELFFAWLGGSPGNLGVLTHVVLRVHRDADYSGALGLRAVHLYSKEKARALLRVLAEMSDDGTAARNYDLCISVLSASFDVLGLLGGEDDRIKEEHPEIWGHDGTPAWPRMIVVYAQWVPFTPTDKPDMRFFDGLRTDAWFQSEPQQKPMNELTAQWIFRNRREFDLPYVKRTYVTNSTSLVRDGWVDWVVEQMDTVIAPVDNGQWLSSQFQYFGGEHSMFSRNRDNGTAFSWRDTTICMTLDNFHKPEKKAAAEAWAARNDAEAIGPEGVFSKTDRRVLWGSYGAFDLDSVWHAYFEDQQKYERLSKIRKVADPHGTFTPNAFSVKRAQ